jgi:uncharacterized protein (DUF2249 family)
MTTTSHGARIDVRRLAPPERDAAVISAFRAIDRGETLEVVVNHDPQPLYHRFRLLAPGNFSWLCLQNGPQVWRVTIKKLALSYSAGECCGACGGKA